MMAITTCQSEFDDYASQRRTAPRLSQMLRRRSMPSSASRESFARFTFMLYLLSSFRLPVSGASSYAAAPHARRAVIAMDARRLARVYSRNTELSDVSRADNAYAMGLCFDGHDGALRRLHVECRCLHARNSYLRFITH